MFEAGELEGDVERLQGPKVTSLFTDEKGFQERLPDTGALISSQAVHGVDPMTMPEFTEWEDIRQISKDIIDEQNQD